MVTVGSDHDLKATINSLTMGIVILDVDQKIEFINEAFHNIWKSSDEDFPSGTDFRVLMEQYRDESTFNLSDEEWEEYVHDRMQEIQNGDLKHREFNRTDGRTLYYSITNLEGNRRLLSYFDVTEEKNQASKLEEAQTETERVRLQLTEAIETLEDGFVFFDNEDKMVICNDAFRQQFKDVPGIEKYMAPGVTYREMTLQLAKSGIVPGIEGKEEQFVDELIEKRHSELGLDKTFKTHDGKWIRQRDVRTESGGIVGVRIDVSEVKESEEIASQSNKLNLSITNSVNQGFLLVKDNKIHFFNRKLAEFFDLDDTDELIAIGKPFEALLDYNLQRANKSDKKERRALILDAIANQTPISDVREFVDGLTVHLEGIPQEDDSYLFTYTDITEERAIQSELAKREALMNSVLSASENGILVTNGYKEVITFNDKARRLLGFSEEDMKTSKSYSDLLKIQFEKQLYATSAAGNAATDFKVFMARAMEMSKSALTSVKTLLMANGDTIRYRGRKLENGFIVHSYVNITNERMREEELKRAKADAERASKIQEASTKTMVQGLLFFQEKKLEFFNPKFLELVGVEPEQIEIGMLMQDVLEIVGALGEFANEAAAKEYKSEMLSNFDASRSYQIVRHMKNGKNLQVDAVARENDGLVVAYSDITESKKREDDLEKAMKEAEAAERAKSEFLANMSHEIRTPMNGVMGMAELLATTELDTKQKMFTDVIVKSGASLLTIINDILDFSKIDAGQLELEESPFNLREAIEDVATLVSAKVAEKDLELIVRVDPALPNTLIGDVGRVRQIATNLLGNAVKFTEIGHIYLNVQGDINEQGEAKIVCSVQDTGIGIPEDKCKTIFQKFSQADTSATRKHEGTGLGLSIASSLAGLMGGSITVESEQGVGSTFTCTMFMQANEQTSEQSVVIPGDMTSARILVVDDNSVNRSILTEQMTAWNFDSAAAEHGEEGLQIMRAVKANRINLDLVILDYQMPGMTGIDVLREMRNDPDLADVPAIMLTSVDGVQTNPELKSLKVEASLTKPTRSSILLETVMQVIANNRALRALQKTQPAGETGPDTDNLQPSPNLPHDPELQSKFEAAALDVLVAEDNEVNQIVFRQILEEAGVTFKIVENGRLAVAAYKAHHPKLILMDVSMPEMNGKDATEAIRTWERKEGIKRVPIVGVTAHALKGDMEACIDAGMDDYLSKPVSPQKLAIKIEQWLSYRKDETAGAPKQ